ncbi:MAG: hypothetical protein H3C27_09255 [Opitutaceae bacterium]|nr:hypothetical protein [Opitutaceae bacterium]
MDWIFDNLQIVLAVAAAFAYWLTQRKQAEQEENEERGPETEQFPTRVDGELADEERARRIREEIRRKIAERAGGMPLPPPAVPEPPPLYRREPEPQPVRPRPQPVPVEPQASAPQAEDPWKSVWVQQQKLQEQMKALADTRRKANEFVSPQAATAPKSVPLVRGVSLREELGDRDRLRRAIILREVIGPPVGLR